MQYVNDDMDDVFRKAAENYPLDTSGADWNKVLAGLQGQVIHKPEKKKDHRRYLWLLMLLPLGLVCNYYYGGRDGKDKYDREGHLGVNHVSSTPVNSQAGATNREKAGVNIAPVVNEKKETNIDLPNSAGITMSGTEASVSSKKLVAFNTNKKRNPSSNDKYEQQFEMMGNSGYSKADSKSNISNGVKSSHQTNINSYQASPYTFFINHEKMKLAATAIHPLAQFDGVSNDASVKPVKEKKSQKLYVGFMAGFDKTTIEGQKASQHGYDYGMLLGYKIGRKWAVEAGAFMDKKYYYTEGKYFKNDGIYMPPNSWITDVDGSCRMWDFSIGGSYSLLQKRKSGVFVATGMSSYIMKEENYDYTYYYAGTGTSVVHNKTYSNESKDFFSIINLSMGYTHRLGKISDLRVEPYMKIPVQGVGVGNLSLFSAGVHIGITGKLF